MATFLMLGQYTAEAVKAATAARTRKIIELISKCGGRVDSMYALTGEVDLAFLVNFPTTEDALRASFTLNKATGIAFATHAALPIEQFDRLLNGPSRTAKATPRRQVSVRAPRLT
jgi:uncharacterized protein with GYD domain